MFKVNEYFDGTVKSIGFTMAEGPATIGVMAPGEYEFGTAQLEVMHVVAGALTVKPDKWRVQPGTVRGLKAALVEFDPDVHAFTRAENYQAASRRARSEAAS